MCPASISIAVQIEVPEGIPVDEVMKRFKNESRRVNTVVEVSRVASMHSRQHVSAHNMLLYSLAAHSSSLLV